MLTSLISKVFAGYAAASLIVVAGMGVVIARKDSTIAKRDTLIERLGRNIDNLKSANELAAEKARTARVQAENDYLQIAQGVQHEADLQIDSARSDAERYIAANSVWRARALGCERQRPRAGAEDSGARGGEAAGEVPQLDDMPDGVIIAADDVRICTQNTVQAQAAREWALQLEAAASN